MVGPSGGENNTSTNACWFRKTVDSGTFLLDGKSFDPTDTKEQEQVVGVVFQDFQLFPHLSVFDITLAPKDGVEKQDKATYTVKAEKLWLTARIGWLIEAISISIIRWSTPTGSDCSSDDGDESKSFGLRPTSALDPGLRQQVEALILDLKNKV